MIVLGIETSCDETAGAIIKTENKQFEILSSVISSQIKLHAKWGGVVPNLAAREHLKNIIPVLDTAMKQAGVSHDDIDLISVTAGPGLIPALLIGVSTAKSLSYLWKKPLIGIHHIEGHIYANFLGTPHPSPVEFPLLCLVVSGGHTQLVLMKKHLDYEIIGQTLDDAVGEAFDKIARILGMNYPGGPEVARKAAEFIPQASIFKIKLPRPMIKSKDYNFSFSGLKTAVLYETKKHPELMKDDRYISEMCHEFQQSAIDVLTAKTISAAKRFKPKSILLAGGVSANLELRKQLGKAVKENFKNISYSTPEFSYSLDNAAMIAIAGYYRWNLLKNKKSLLTSWKTLEARADLKLTR